MSISNTTENFSNFQEVPDSFIKSTCPIKESQINTGLTIIPETPNEVEKITCNKFSSEVLPNQQAALLLKKHHNKVKKCVKCIYDDCNFASYSNTEVSLHTEQHRLQGESYECIDCNLKFLKKDNYIKHSNVHSKDSKRLIACEFPGCDKKYTTIYTREVNIVKYFIDSYAQTYWREPF